VCSDILDLLLISAVVADKTRAGCSYLKQLCTDEFNLFKEFFNSGENQL
jgi:hypothetical protein